ncbi:hypothetical protein R6Q59_009585 [Mikania micrantha]
MNDSDYRVDTVSRLAQWRVDNFGSASYRKSDPFRIGKWNWHLVLEKNRNLIIKLFPEIPKLARDNLPIASFNIRVISLSGGRKTLVHPEIRDKQLRSGEGFVWVLDVKLTGRFIVDLEFLDLKTASPNGGENQSLGSEGFTQNNTNSTTLSSVRQNVIRKHPHRYHHLCFKRNDWGSPGCSCCSFIRLPQHVLPQPQRERNVCH